MEWRGAVRSGISANAPTTAKHSADQESEVLKAEVLGSKSSLDHRKAKLSFAFLQPVSAHP